MDLDSHTGMPFHAETTAAQTQSDGSGVGEGYYFVGDRATTYLCPLFHVCLMQWPKHPSTPRSRSPPRYPDTQVRLASTPTRLAARLSMETCERRSDRTTTTGGWDGVVVRAKRAQRGNRSKQGVTEALGDD
jgi:hypothetical protein